MFKPVIPGAPVFLSRKQAAKFLGCTPQYLALMAMDESKRPAGVPPSPIYYKRPGKSGRVSYKLSELVEWIESGRQEPAVAAAE